MALGLTPRPRSPMFQISGCTVDKIFRCHFLVGAFEISGMFHSPVTHGMVQPP